jgi:glyoxylase-like metal-dependent hydrolase (beta-lactamase superfamily II)
MPRDRQGGWKPSWFEVRDLGDGVFLLAESLRFCPEYETGTVNSYLVLGRRRAVLLDTGMGIGDIAAEVQRLTSLEIVVVNSHSHWDHIGGNADFRDIRIHASEAPELEKSVSLPELGWALAEPRDGALDEPRDGRLGPASSSPPPHRVRSSLATATLADGDILDLGDRALRVLHVPGHSPGSLALHDEEGGLLFTADTVYDGTIWLLGDEAAGEAAVDAPLILNSIGKMRAAVEHARRPLAGLLPGHERTPLEPAFLPRLERALRLALDLASREPVARKLTVDGLDFLFPPEPRDRHG